MARLRSQSGSTITPVLSNEDATTIATSGSRDPSYSARASLSIHDESFSREPIVFAESFLANSGLTTGTLVEVKQLLETTEIRDFESKAATSSQNDAGHANGDKSPGAASSSAYLCLVKALPSELANRQHNLEVSVSKQIASTFNFVSRAQITITATEKQKWSSSHAEISFRDAYLSRSDMWRFVSQEMVGRTIYTGQKLTFLNSLKATVRNIHVHGRHAQAAYFDSTTVPIFRSEAARYVIFIQMSREMWDFDSEGDGEILFNRVVNGFLPELFKRWSNMEVRHLVSIVMFGRLEYKGSDLGDDLGLGFKSSFSSSVDSKAVDHQDFYRVVVTDMASAQWATILEELKKDFRVFLRDVSLFRSPEKAVSLPTGHTPPKTTKITGRLSGALKGNILEAINLAATQFSRDYVDRDLIRTGISTIVITAGSGVFDVDRDLLKLTSETLTNNGIGIDVVCLSRMPLHSVPLFRYRLQGEGCTDKLGGMRPTLSPSSIGVSLARASLPDMGHSPAFSSTNASVTYYSRFPSAFPTSLPQIYGYGIPQWIDLSYWSSEMGYENFRHRRRLSHLRYGKPALGDLFIPRVRMYELQMMGLMELGMAEIIVPYLNESGLIGDTNTRRWNSRLLRSQYSRSFSQSPELKRKSPVLARRSHGQFGLPRDQTSVDAGISATMDHYDDNVFLLPSVGSRRDIPQRKPKKTTMEKGPNLKKNDRQRSPPLSTRQSSSSLKTRSDADTHSMKSSVVSSPTTARRPTRAPRSISYMLRGLAPMKASAITPEVHVENVAAQRPASEVTDGSSDESRPKLKARIESSSQSSRLSPEQHEPSSPSSRPGTAAGKVESSKPIRINAGGTTSTSESSVTKQLWQQKRKVRKEGLQSADRLEEERSSDSDSPSSEASTAAASNNGSLPADTIPFIRNVNASNPLKRQNDPGSFGRWQHLYPRKPRAATVKWRSLCTPASVPLTTEDFPLKEELEDDYDAKSHVVRTFGPDETTSNPEVDMHMLFVEMISLRVSHGYQFVTGDRVSDAVGELLADYSTLFDTEVCAKPRLVVVLAMANTIQKLELNKALSVRVTKYVQRSDLNPTSRRGPVIYSPYVRTILAHDYLSRHFRFQGFSEQYPWETADNYLADSNREPRDTVEQLRCWRARYVLLPVEPPASTWKTHQPDETEEEIHLLGIRALTQLWQKNRYTTAGDRQVLQNRAGSTKTRDLNPLQVKMETLNPAELVTLELDRLSLIEDGTDQESTHLLPEPQKLDRETSMHKFAAVMQSDRGIDIKARRWHWRLYYNCFHGEEFTNWLLHNVMQLNTRDDAVEFGNKLMEEGLFEHVNGRHKFKDGNYFYSIKSEFRSARPEQNKLWFLNNRQANKSNQPTPVTEQPSKETSPLSIRTRSGSNIAQQLNASSTTDNSSSSLEKKRKTVSLSRMIRIDVDPRKKSVLGRPEVVSVHYDRFHNPENCYHLELTWLSTTCKLVDDAIVSWTNTAEKYGLKLVEVPIAELCDIPVAEPFRNPYRIKLAVEPPKQKANHVVFSAVNFSASSLGSHAPVAASPANKHMYQKAILKRSNFVLDLEAANEFPEGVDIQYSWGQLDYKYTQFVHRSGVILAQIMDNGDIMLLANRLYNSRLANTKESGTRGFDPRREVGPQSHRPAILPSLGVSMQASGIVGVNLASPSIGGSSSPGLNPVFNVGAAQSPVPRPFGSHLNAPQTPHTSKPVIADSFGPKSAFAATGLWNTLITPEQIKDDLEAFCHDKVRLEQFYREVTNASTPVSGGPGSGSRKATGSSSSSLLRPVREVPSTVASDIMGMPAFELPEAVTAVRELRRATVAFDSVADLLDRTRIENRNGSTGSRNDAENGRPSSITGTSSPLRKDTK